jgi:hypothetical protein
LVLQRLAPARALHAAPAPQPGAAAPTDLLLLLPLLLL